MISKLIFDIETVGQDFDSLDEITQKNLTEWIQKEAEDSRDLKIRLEDLKNNLGFSPLTGQIVAIGILNPETDKGAVWFQAPGKEEKVFQENGVKFESGNEKEILEKFWQVASNYNEFISFNGRRFDAPFLLIRSAINKLTPTKDLMSNRYLASQKFGAKHIDLLDQLTFYGAFWKKGNFHLWCRAFGIKSPKENGVTGEDIGRLFSQEKYLEIARYCLGDVVATKELFSYWEKYLRFEK